MSMLATGFGRFLTAVCLLATVACSLVAFSTDMDEFVFVAMFFAIIPVVIGYSRQRDRPSDCEVQAFLQRLFHQSGGRYSFSIRSFRSGMFSILYGRRGYIPFRIQAELAEPLFEKVNVPWARLAGLTPRRIETLRKQAAALADAFGSEGAALREEMPPDLFSVCFIAEKMPKGRSLYLSGAVTATPGVDGWIYALEFLNCGRKPLEELGRAQGAFSQPVIVGSRGGESWMVETVAAWQAFSKKLVETQERMASARADRGEWAVQTFFRDVKAGTIFHGLGHSQSGQHAVTHFFAEIRSSDAATRSAIFTLRNDSAWENVRRFTATVSFDVAEKCVWLHGVTHRDDCCRDGGPLVGATNGFTLEFHFAPGSPARLVSFGGDVSMQLEEVSRSALRTLRTSVYGRPRKALDAAWAGVLFDGTLAQPEAAARVTLLLLEPSSSARPTEAKIESGGWSGLFSIQEINNPYSLDDCDLVLSPAGTASSQPATSGTVVHGWRRVLLMIVEGGFDGRIETAHGVIDLSLRRQSDHAGAVAASGDSAATSISAE